MSGFPVQSVQVKKELLILIKQQYLATFYSQSGIKLSLGEFTNLALTRLMDDIDQGKDIKISFKPDEPQEEE